MDRIDALVPAADKVDAAALREVDADALARYVIDPGHQWWRRRPCVEALTGRIPDRYVADLIGRVTDPGAVAEVRIALLDLLADRAELSPWLQHADRRDEDSYGLPEAILKARGMAGDGSAIREIAALAADPWSHTRKVGQAGMDALVDRYGAEAVLAELGEASPAERAAGIRIRHAAGEDVTEALNDPDRSVAYLAASLATDPDRLRRHLKVASTIEAKLWTAYALHRRTGDAAETRVIDDALGRPRVDVPGLDAEIRAAVVHEYAPICEWLSDPRWRNEVLCTDPPQQPDQDAQLARVASALAAAGFDPEPPVYCGDEWGSGGGTYHLIKYGQAAPPLTGRNVHVSTLGRFVTGDDTEATARRAVESAGFRWIDDATAAIVVTDLCVYFFGDRDPLGVGDLLFYWQD